MVAIFVIVVVSEASWVRKWQGPIRVAILVTVVVSGRSRSPSLSLAKGLHPQLHAHRQVLIDSMVVFCENKHEKMLQAQIKYDFGRLKFINAHLELGDNRLHTTGVCVGLQAVRNPSRLLGGLCRAQLRNSLHGMPYRWEGEGRVAAWIMHGPAALATPSPRTD